MTGPLFWHQLTSLMRRRRLIGLALLALVPAAIILAVGLTGEGADNLVPEIVAEAGGSTFPIAALILAAATLRDERDAGTLPYLYLKPIGRPTMAMISILAAFVASAVLALVAWLAVLVAAAVVAAPMGEALATGPLFLAAGAGYSALFVPLGYTLPRVVLAGLAYVILWEQVLSRVVAGAANTSIWHFAVSIYADLIGGSGLDDFLGPVAAGVGGGMAKLGVVAVLGMALLTWALTRRDAV